MQLRYLVFSSIVLCAPAWAEQATEVDAYAEGFRAFERGDYAAARRIWTPLAESDDPRAQFGLGLIYEGGLGDTPMDQEEALGWYRRAARQGVPAAQNNLAIMYAEGRGVSQDPTLAVTLWRQAAEAGYGPSQLNLAAALERGVGVERSEREATLWHEKAKAQGLTSVEPGHVDHTDERSPVTAAKEASVRPPSPPPAPPTASAFYVQLASHRDHEAAVRLGGDLSSRHGEVLAELEPTVRTVDLESKGVWHRVLFGPLPSRESAMVVCARIRARAGDCLVAPGELRQ